MAQEATYFNIIDLECTCWDITDPEARPNEIIEIGIVQVNLRELRVEKQQSYFVIPEEGYISEFCTNLTSLTPEFIETHGKPLRSTLDRMSTEFRVKKYGWGSWGDFDRVQFERECHRKNLKYPFGRVHKNLKYDFSLFLGIKSQMGLERALSHFDMQFLGEPHRGVDDAYNTARLCIRLWGSSRNYVMKNIT